MIIKPPFYIATGREKSMCKENTLQLYAEMVWLEFHVNIDGPLTFALASPLMKSWMVTLSNY